jgi:ABC-type oligopeptide transport system ATPase subunit
MSPALIEQKYCSFYIPPIHSLINCYAIKAIVSRPTSKLFQNRLQHCHTRDLLPIPPSQQEINETFDSKNHKAMYDCERISPRHIDRSHFKPFSPIFVSFKPKVHRLLMG